jgi:NitT/TauT family transport system substrate-binding protein
MNRRAFLQLTGLAALSGLLQACGGTVATPPSSAGAAPSSAPASAKPAGSGAASAQPAASSAGGSAAAKPGAGKLVVSYGALVGSFLPLWVAKETGLFTKYGLDVDMPFVESTAAVASQIAGEIQAQEVSGAPVITADANGNQDLVFIASDLNHPIIALYAAPEIKTAADLKGKPVGSGLPGSPVEYATFLALSLLGLKPTDVEIRRLGPNQVLPQLLAGALPAGSIAPPETFQAEAKGFHLLQDIYSKPYQNVGIVAKRSRLDELAGSMRQLLGAYRDAIQAIYNDPAMAMKVQGQYGKIDDQDILKKSYDFYTKTAPYQKDLQPTLEGIQAQIDFLAQTADKVKGHKAEEFVDTRFLKDLPKA